MEKQLTKKSVTIHVNLDERNMPESMTWDATDSPDAQPCKAMLLSLFDEVNRDILKIDLWTRDMQIVEMDRLMYQTLKGLADTYFTATKNNELATQMQQFAQYFGEKTQSIGQ
jgi:gliding motility-associated protein GldC